MVGAGVELQHLEHVVEVRLPVEAQLKVKEAVVRAREERKGLERESRTRENN